MKLKAVVLTSTSMRHNYFVETMANHFEVIGVYCEEKKKYYSDQKERSEEVRNHFESVSVYEKKYFSGKVKSDLKFDLVENINDPGLVMSVSDADVVLLFGTSILKECWLDRFKNKIINLHLGVSPFFRGSATLFWAFYYDVPELCGATIHIAAKKVDAGNILSHVFPEIDVNDNYYDVTTKTIIKSIDIFPTVVNDYVSGNIHSVKQDLEKTKYLKFKKDFSDETLSKVLDVYGTSISISNLELKKRREKWNVINC